MRTVKKRHMRIASAYACARACAPCPLLEAAAGDTAAPLPTPTQMPAGEILTVPENGAKGEPPAAEPSTPVNDPGGVPSTNPSETPTSFRDHPERLRLRRFRRRLRRRRQRRP